MYGWYDVCLSTLSKVIFFGWNKAAEKRYMETETHEKC